MLGGQSFLCLGKIFRARDWSIGLLANKMIVITDGHVLRNYLTLFQQERILWQFYHFPCMRNCAPLEKFNGTLFFCLCYTGQSFHLWCLSSRRRTANQSGINSDVVFPSGQIQKKFSDLSISCLETMMIILVSLFCELKNLPFFVVGTGSLESFRNFADPFYYDLWKEEVIN